MQQYLPFFLQTKPEKADINNIECKEIVDNIDQMQRVNN